MSTSIARGLTLRIAEVGDVKLMHITAREQKPALTPPAAEDG
jgi:hypothetical protein